MPASMDQRVAGPDRQAEREEARRYVRRLRILYTLLGVGGLFGADWERRRIDRYLERRDGGRGGGAP